MSEDGSQFGKGRREVIPIIADHMFREMWWVPLPPILPVLMILGCVFALGLI